MKHWLVKTEATVYSWHDLERDKVCVWSGVRNYQARNFMIQMKKGDLVFVYHSGKSAAIVGVAKVVKEHYPDPEDPRFVLIDLVPVKKLDNEIQLVEIKNCIFLKDFILLRQKRLSVMPVTKEEWEQILKII
ncbi:MAG: EVE domain-containing protein [Bacteroidota bacterium]